MEYEVVPNAKRFLESKSSQSKNKENKLFYFFSMKLFNQKLEIYEGEFRSAIYQSQAHRSLSCHCSAELFLPLFSIPFHATFLFFPKSDELSLPLTDYQLCCFAEHAASSALSSHPGLVSRHPIWNGKTTTISYIKLVPLHRSPLMFFAYFI